MDTDTNTTTTATKEAKAKFCKSLDKGFDLLVKIEGEETLLEFKPQPIARAANETARWTYPYCQLGFEQIIGLLGSSKADSWLQSCLKSDFQRLWKDSDGDSTEFSRAFLAGEWAETESSPEGWSVVKLDKQIKSLKKQIAIAHAAGLTDEVTRMKGEHKTLLALIMQKMQLTEL